MPKMPARSGSDCRRAAVNLSRHVGVVVAVLLAEILDVRELGLDRLAESLFSLVGRRDPGLTLTTNTLPAPPICFGQTSRREPAPFDVVGRDVAQLDVGVDRRVHAQHGHAGVDRRLDRGDHAAAGHSAPS